MSGGGKFRSGDTVPPQMLGQDPSLDRALGKLNQQLDPDEDALYVKPDWSERPDVSLTPISQQITQELEPAAIDALQQGERTSSSPPEQAPAGMSDLYKRRMITVQTATVPRGESGSEIFEECAEPPPAVELGEPSIREDQRTVIPRRLALLIGVAAAALILLLGALLGHDVGRKGAERTQTSSTSASPAEVAKAGTVAATASAAPQATVLAPETTAATKEEPTPGADASPAVPTPIVTARQGTLDVPKVRAPKVRTPAPEKSSKPNVGFEPVSSDFTSP